MDNGVCKGVGLGPEAYFRNFTMGTELKISLTETSRGGGEGWTNDVTINNRLLRIFSTF